MSYITDRSPNRFGGQQANYIAQTSGIVEKTATSFRDHIDSQKDLNALFHTTLSFLGSERQRIAQEHVTENKEEFGVRRDQHVNHYFQTILASPYENYNKKLLALFKDDLRALRRTKREFEQIELRIDKGMHLEKPCHIEYNLLTFENQKKWVLLPNFEGVSHLCASAGVASPKSESETQDAMSQLFSDKAAIQKLMQEAPTDYLNFLVTQMTLDLRKTYPGERKTDWICASMRIEIEGTLYTLSQYVTWLCRDFIHDPIHTMAERSVVVILHHDRNRIESTLNIAAKLFKEALEWDQKELPQLKERVVLLTYVLNHATPFMRGSAAVSEWFEKSIYKCFGMDLTYNPEKCLNLEALTTPFPEFARNYDSMIQLKPT